MSIKTQLIPIILCGGAGSRLWPVSREQHPKPLIRLDDGESLLQKAFQRGANLPNVSDVITVTNKDLLFQTEDEYREISPKLNREISNTYILEPFGRNTAPAIALASLAAIENHGEDVVLLVLAADHLVKNTESFKDAVIKAIDLAEQGKIVTFGIQPEKAETGYGYIQADDTNVKQFVEKPTLDNAQKYLESGEYFWNSGMFCFKPEVLLRELEKHRPDIMEHCNKCFETADKSSIGQINEIAISADCFESVPNDSIDYALMERTDQVSVVTCDIGWSDIGSWNALGNLTEPDENNNRLHGEIITNDSTNCTISSDTRLVGVVGVNDLIIIDTPDALLVADKSNAQNVKSIYTQLKSEGHAVHKFHDTVHRPWGTYTVIEEGEHYKVKRIKVKPGASLSMQSHRHRSEHWVVITGQAKVTNNETEMLLNVNESTFILAGHKHRLENATTENLIIIEVQTGSYLGEDDIVRYDDIYGRLI